MENKNNLKDMIENRIDDIVTLLAKGKDVEIRNAKEGIRVIEISKKVI